MENKQQAINEAAQMKRMLPFRIHYVYNEKGSVDFWQSGCSTTMARPNNLVRKGAVVEILQ